MIAPLVFSPLFIRFWELLGISPQTAFLDSKVVLLGNTVENGKGVFATSAFLCRASVAVAFASKALSLLFLLYTNVNGSACTCSLSVPIMAVKSPFSLVKSPDAV